MRLVVFLLLIGNLALFALLYQGLQPSPVEPQSVNDGGLRAVSPGAGLAGDCLVSEAIARQVEAQLAIFRLEVPHSLVLRQRERRDGWRVHLSPADSLESARRQLEALRAAGFEDAALATDAAQPNTVALASHSQREDAVLLRREALGRGFDSHISPRIIREAGYHLVLQADVVPSHLQGFGWTAEPCEAALRE